MAQESLSLALCVVLLAMLGQEPVLHCLGETEFTGDCQVGKARPPRF